MAAENHALTAAQSAGPAASMWDLDDARQAPLPPRRRAARAAGVAAIWALGVAPAALGLQRCTVAAVFHRPCPGCGMTRAIHLFVAGHLDASLQMHPLAVPAAATWMIFMAGTVWTTWTAGTPLAVLQSRQGRATLLAIVVVYAAAFVLWTLRWFGFFGGPVPV